MSDERSMEEELEVQVSERLALMEDPNYEYPKQLGKVDWAIITAIPIICFVLLVIGEFL